MTDPQIANSGPAADATNELRSRSATLKIWSMILIAYVVLLITTGYIAFFQPAYNPAVDIDDYIQERLLDDSTRDFTIESLREESVAFKQRRELAVQSFNIVLGAALGFLAALASQAMLKRRQD